MILQPHSINAVVTAAIGAANIETAIPNNSAGVTARAVRLTLVATAAGDWVKVRLGAVGGVDSTAAHSFTLSAECCEAIVLTAGFKAIGVSEGAVVVGTPILSIEPLDNV